MPQEKHGVVYISADEQGYGGYWDNGFEPHDILEIGPGWTDPDQAVRWGRDRAPRVFIRIGRHTYSAGDIDPENEAVPRWESR